MGRSSKEDLNRALNRTDTGRGGSFAERQNPRSSYSEGTPDNNDTGLEQSQVRGHERGAKPTPPKHR